MRVYAHKRDHLNAYDMAELLAPLMLGERVWVPELEMETVPLQRVFLAEKWLVARLIHGHADPREAGVGNIVNCGAAMYVAPVGIANAGDPDGAYAEAIDIAGAHQSSYGREAAGVFAAAVAAAFQPGATVDSIVDTCVRLARDGTRAAIEAVCAAARDLYAGDVAGTDAPGGLADVAGTGDVADADGPAGLLDVTGLRAVMAPFDTVGEDYRDPGLGARRPSRLHAIEELPLALGCLVAAGGDYRRAVLAAVNYGRDSDSIATMAGAVAGALSGIDAVPPDWRDTVARNSRLDLTASGRTMAGVAAEIFERDRRREAARDTTRTALLAAGEAVR